MQGKKGRKEERKAKLRTWKWKEVGKEAKTDDKQYK